MGITSPAYFAFIVAVVVIYYCLPKKAKWPYLLLCSIVYVLLSGEPLLILYPIATVFVTWICTNRMPKPDKNGDKEKTTKQRKMLLLVALAANLGVLIVLKYLNLGVYTYNAFAERTGSDELLAVFSFAAPIGLSFYTISLMGYLFDVYYEICEPEKNYLKLLLFGMYFPLLISGPIIRYKDTAERLYEGHRPVYKNIAFGAQRILVGLLKVLVISERLAVAVTEIFDNFENYPGTYIIIGAVCFSLRLYTNFSGSMDIVIGLSECMGIELPENFRQPFFSETIQEFWQRWHITLGAWLKDYILYPLLRTDTFMKLPGKWKDKLGKKRAKQFTTFIALFILWFTVGLWHGGSWKIIFGTGLLQWTYIVISELCTPAFKKMKKVMHINDKAVLFRLFKKVRTFALISVGFMFFNAGSLSDGFGMIRSLFAAWNPEIIVDGSLLGLGLDIKDWCIVCLSLLLLLVYGKENEKEDWRQMISNKNLVIRWGFWLAIIFFVIVFGSYGPGYNAAEFIYQGF